MKSNRNLLSASLLAAAAAVTAAAGISIATAADQTAPAASSAPGPQGWHHHRHGGWHMLSKLNLSAEQKAAVKNIMANAGPQMKSIRQETGANSLKLRQTQPNDPNYANVVAQVAQANGSLHSQMLTQRESVRAQVFQVLTPAQQTQLTQMQSQMQARMQARRAAWAQRNAGAPPSVQ